MLKVFSRFVIETDGTGKSVAGMTTGCPKSRDASNPLKLIVPIEEECESE